MKAATTRTAISPHFHFIGGKGGVGKTTCAAAFAVAHASAGVRVLVASTDPAPSLGDAFKMRLSRSPTRVEAGFSRPTLHAVEIDASAVLRRWIDERRSGLEKIALEGTWLDRDDVTKLLDLSLPGIDEVAALLEIARLARTGRYDRIVVDTAPTGHTLRMLAMPDTLFGVARVFDRMREKHRAMVDALRGGWTSDQEDVLIHDLAREAKDLSQLLTDPGRRRLSWVTLPEPMSIAEAEDAIGHLGARNMPVDDIIVNRLTPRPAGRCLYCSARRLFEAKALRTLPPCERLLVMARDNEPRGMTALAAIGRELHRPPKVGLHRARLYGSRDGQLASERGRSRSRARDWTAIVQGGRVPAEAIVGPTTRLVMFGGKGGVGKTTCAAAVAIAFAERRRDLKVLLISTDPAHSLGDALGVAVSDRPAPMRGAPRNLFVREMDAARVFERVRMKYATAIDGLFDRIAGGGGFDIGHDRSVMHALIDLAPPGLDELAATVEITESVSDDAGLTVIDTAPTGHALRLLEMPALIHDWTKALMAILLKYQPVTGLGELGQLLLNLSKGLGRLRELLTDHERTRFIVISRPAALPRIESGRLLQRLRRLDISAPFVVINAVGRGGCRRCVKAAAAERREVDALIREVHGSRAPAAIVVAGARIPPPRSPAALARWQRSGWRYHQDA